MSVINGKHPGQLSGIQDRAQELRADHLARLMDSASFTIHTMCKGSQRDIASVLFAMLGSFCHQTGISVELAKQKLEEVLKDVQRSENLVQPAPAPGILVPQ